MPKKYVSDTYKELQKKLHSTGQYGVTGWKYGNAVSKLIKDFEINSLLDYGCGSNLSLHQTLKPSRDIEVQCYDPCVACYATPPRPAELVVALDVLEHIELEYLYAVIDHLRSLTRKLLFVSIHTGPAKKFLADGRNAHLIQEPPDWWLKKLGEKFSIRCVEYPSNVEFIIVAS